MLSLCDAFGGICAFPLAARNIDGIVTTGIIEADIYLQRLAAKNFPSAAIYGDIATVIPHRGQWDIITAGFPCQDISQSKTGGQGLDGPKSGLFWVLRDFIAGAQPRIVILENVYAIKRAWTPTAILELNKIGYKCDPPRHLRACDFGAIHERHRTFLVAYATGERCIPPQTISLGSPSRRPKTGADLKSRNACSDGAWQLSISRAIRSDDGVPSEVDLARIRALGNSIYVPCAEHVLREALRGIA
jgi:DNA (cytosine-5)-methyltransferase 1